VRVRLDLDDRESRRIMRARVIYRQQVWLVKSCRDISAKRQSRGGPRHPQICRKILAVWLDLYYSHLFIGSILG